MLSKDCITLVAREINDLNTFITLSRANKQCQQIINQIIAFGESKYITTDYYVTIFYDEYYYTNDTYFNWCCFLPEISDQTCHGCILNGLEIIKIPVCEYTDTYYYVTRNWCMDKVDPLSIKFYPSLDTWPKNNFLKYLGITDTSVKLNNFYTEVLYDKHVFPCDPEEIETMLNKLKSL